MATASGSDEGSELSKRYETPLGLAHSTMQGLKDRIKRHYDLASDYYLSLWGEHIHHGYWPTPESKANDTKEAAQLNLINLLLDMSELAEGAHVLDVGCGIGGTSRYLASKLACTVTGITISSSQVEIANRLTQSGAAGTAAAPSTGDDDGFLRVGEGKVRFVELDAEKIGDYFKSAEPLGDGQEPLWDATSFDAVWICEALSHFPDKALFFQNAYRVLRPGARLIIADWFKAEDLADEAIVKDIKPIEDGMLLPPLCTQQEYVSLANAAGLQVLAGPKDISEDVKKTWDITWSLIQDKSLWAFAWQQGRDGLAFLQSFLAMRRGYANGNFRYAVMAFKK